MREVNSPAAIDAIIPVSVRTSPKPDGRTHVATVPVVLIPLLTWRSATSTDTVERLVEILRTQGGRWLAARATADCVWRVSIAHVEAEVKFAGEWQGHFTLTAALAPLSRTLWPLALSPLVAFMPAEVAPAVINDITTEPVGLNRFHHILDHALHTRTTPASAIADIVRKKRWPGHTKMVIG